MKTIQLQEDLYKTIREIQDLSILEELKVLVNERISSIRIKKNDFWDELPAKVKEEIEQSISEAERGEVYSHDEVMKEMQFYSTINLSALTTRPFSKT